MRHEAKTRSLFSLTWPIFIETLLYMVMGNADTLMLSQYSDHAVAAVGVANQIIALTIVLFNFVALATAVLVAQYLGARREQEAVDVVRIVVKRHSRRIQRADFANDGFARRAAR
jgi:Na+-driven multidrug efflux pump